MNRFTSTTACGEQAILVRHLAAVQRRCDALLREQAAEIAALRAQNMKLRATLIVRHSALAWAQEDRRAQEAADPGPSQRAALARKVKLLTARLQDLMRDTLRPAITVPRRDNMPPVIDVPAPATTASPAITPSAVPCAPAEVKVEEEHAMSDLEASIMAADLVICQTGCLSHGAYWRVQEHCRRTGKTCMLVKQPTELRVVRIHQKDRLHALATDPHLFSEAK